MLLVRRSVDERMRDGGRGERQERGTRARGCRNSGLGASLFFRHVSEKLKSEKLKRAKQELSYLPGEV